MSAEQNLVAAVKALLEQNADPASVDKVCNYLCTVSNKLAIEFFLHITYKCLGPHTVHANGKEGLR